MNGKSDQRAYTTEVPIFRCGRIAEIGIRRQNRPIPAENRATGHPDSRPLILNERTPETRISAVRCTADAGRSVDSDGVTTDTGQFLVRPEIRLSGDTVEKLRMGRISGIALESNFQISSMPESDSAESPAEVSTSTS